MLVSDYIKHPRLISLSDGTVIDLNKIVYVEGITLSSYSPSYKIYFDNSLCIQVYEQQDVENLRCLKRDTLIKAWKAYLGES